MYCQGGFIVSEPREMHPRSEIADVPTSPCPPLDNLGCPGPDPHPLMLLWCFWPVCDESCFLSLFGLEDPT